MSSQKNIPYLTLAHEQLGIFCELFGEKLLQNIESALY